MATWRRPARSLRAPSGCRPTSPLLVEEAARRLASRVAVADSRNDRGRRRTDARADRSPDHQWLVRQGSLRISPSDGDSSTKTRCFEIDQLGIARARVAASARSRGRCLVEKGRTAQLSCEQRNEPWCALVWLMELTGRSTHESFGSGDCLSCLR